MKIFCIAFCAMLCMTATYAQKYVPQIKQGTVIAYQAHSNALGQSLPLIMTIKNADSPLQLQWTLTGYGTGTFTISAAAVESGNRIGFKQPDPDEDTKLKDNETLITISKSTFKDLMTNKTFLLNNQTFTVMQDTADFKINDKPADVFYAVNQNGKTKLWILNNPAFPLICKLTGGPQGIDLTLTGITP